jgi:hypothetical protein
MSYNNHGKKEWQFQRWSIHHRYALSSRSSFLPLSCKRVLFLRTLDEQNVFKATETRDSHSTAIQKSSRKTSERLRRSCVALWLHVRPAVKQLLLGYGTVVHVKHIGTVLRGRLRTVCTCLRTPSAKKIAKTMVTSTSTGFEDSLTLGEKTAK